MPHHYSQYESFLKYKQRLNIAEYCRNSTIPTLVIHGSADTSVTVEEGKQIAAWLSTDLIVIEGEQHTFGSSQPWLENKLPDGLLKVCHATLRFFSYDKKRKSSRKKRKN